MSQTDDSMLLEVSASQRSHLTSARETLHEAIDAHAAAEAERARKLEARSMAGLERDAAVVKVKRVEDSLQNAISSGTTEDVDAARQALQVASDEQAVHDAQVALRDREAAYASALVTLANEEMKVAAAKVELVKAEAVNTLDRPDSQMPEVNAFEAGLRAAEGNRNVARTESEVAKREVAVASALVEERKLACERR